MNCHKGQLSEGDTKPESAMKNARYTMYRSCDENVWYIIEKSKSDSIPLRTDNDL